MRTYKAVLFAPDGEWVTDYRGRPTIADVQDALANQGSRWYFYPIVAVIRDRGWPYGSLTTERQRIVDAPEGAEWMKGRSIGTIRRALAADPTVAAGLMSL